MSVVFLLLLLILVINPLLGFLVRRWQFSAAEHVVIFGLVYTACCIPGAGLMRYWMVLLTRGFFAVHEHPLWATIFNDVPDWLFPTKDPNSPVVEKFWRGFGASETISWQTWSELASAWLVPFLTWGIFLFAVFICMWCLAALLRRQWVENEKLSFPLAQVALEIIRPPPKGRLVNDLFRNKLLWIGVGLVIFIHATGVLNKWMPNVPAIPITYSVGRLFSNAPWNQVQYFIHWGRICFTAIGVAYFITTRCSFSLWFFVVVVGFAPVVGAQFGYPIEWGAWRFHFLGAMLVLMASIVWVSRAHLRLILLAVIGRHKEPEGSEYMSYRTAAIVFLISFAAAALWLTLAGMKFYFALALLVLLFMIFLTMARIVAETGLFLVHTYFQPLNTAQFFATPRIEHNSFLMSAMVSRLYFDVNENHLPYAVNALRVADGTSRIRRRRLLIPILLLGMLVAYGVSAASMGRLAYKHGAISFSDPYGANRAVADFDSTVNYRTGANQPTYSPVLHTCIGATVMALLALARFRWVRWPLYPIGWLLSTTWAMHAIWVSVLLGWLAKAGILKFGGVDLYNRLKPFFIGLIIGEVIAGAILAAAVLGFDLHLPFQIMPT